jgi:hypothetical protein
MLLSAATGQDDARGLANWPSSASISVALPVDRRAMWMKTGERPRTHRCVSVVMPRLVMGAIEQNGNNNNINNHKNTRALPRFQPRR